jgi:hypothetical protein
VSNIINFPPKPTHKADEKDDWFIIETSEDTRWAKNLESIMDELWHEIYCGKEITNVFADDDGRIHFWLEQTGRKGSFQALQKHFSFFVRFFNKNCRFMFDEFYSEYEKFIVDQDVQRLISKKENSPS